MESKKRIYSFVANILKYPTDQLSEQLREGIEMFSPQYPEAVKLLNKFLSYVVITPLGKLEELYTSVFDIKPSSPLYVGYYLFGDDFHKRSEFMVRLKEFYKEVDFDAESERELPDHLTLMAGYLAILEDENQERIVLADSIIPAMRKMEEVFEKEDGKDSDNQNPYGQLLRAIAILMEKRLESIA